MTKKFTFQVTVEVDNPSVYTLDEDGRAVGPPVDRLNKYEAAGYVAEAVRVYGGAYAPGDPFHISNIVSVRVRDRFNKKIDVTASSVRYPDPEETPDDV